MKRLHFYKLFFTFDMCFACIHEHIHQYTTYTPIYYGGINNDIKYTVTIILLQ